MAPLTTSSHKPIRAAGLESGPAVINVRRPAAARTETPHFQPRPEAEFPLLDDAPPPQTALRLPDLAALVKRLPKRHLEGGAIAQWVGIALGGVLALWLIFGGGSAPQSEVNDAPTWSPPSSASSAPAYADPNPSTKQPNANDPVPPELPEWDDSATRSAPPAAPGAGVRTAQRDNVPAQAQPPGAPPSEAPSLGITIGVPQ
jgi:hypothetical protein